MEFWAPRVFYKHKELEKEIERREGERREFLMKMNFSWNVKTFMNISSVLLIFLC